MFLALRPGRAARGRHRSCCRAALPRLPPARPFWGGAGRAVAGEPCRLRRGPPLGRPTGLTRCAHTTAVFSVVRAACARQHARGTPEPPHAFSNSRGSHAGLRGPASLEVMAAVNCGQSSSPGQPLPYLRQHTRCRERQSAVKAAAGGFWVCMMLVRQGLSPCPRCIAGQAASRSRWKLLCEHCCVLSRPPALGRLPPSPLPFGPRSTEKLHVYYMAVEA